MAGLSKPGVYYRGVGMAVCAAGLLAGPLVGGTVGLFVTWLAVGNDGQPLGSVGISILCGGLAGGWLHQWRRQLAQHPLTGFGLTVGVSLLRRRGRLDRRHHPARLFGCGMQSVNDPSNCLGRGFAAKSHPAILDAAF